VTADIELIGRLAELLATRITKAGHLAAIVPQEHRGNCPVQGCGPACIEANAVLLLAVEHLEGALGIERDAWMARLRRRAS
jgi:hypothetical protein